MIRLESISKSYPNGELFTNVNIFLKGGMRAGLVGPNGAGKTTLLRIMLGEESPDSGNIQKDKALTIGYLAQDIVESSEKSILKQVLKAYPEVLELERKIESLSIALSQNSENIDLINQLGEFQNRFEALGGWSLEKKAKKILGGLGFSETQFSSSMTELSGGWRMRVALATILLQEPDILFLDEPTNHLDLEATIWLESFLSDWKGGLIMISHDREFLDRSINHTLEIDLKNVTLYKGNFSEYLIAKSLRQEQQRNAYHNQQKQIKDTERFIDRFRSKNTKSTQVQSRIKMLDKMEKVEAPSDQRSEISLILPQPSRSPLNVISCRNINKNYGLIEVFNELDMVVERGQKIGLVGHNGAGKSTLLKMLAGVEKVTSGAVRLGSGVVRSYYAQHQLEVLDIKDTVYESVSKVSPGWSDTEIRKYLGSFLFSGDEIEKLVRVLSGGEKARLAMARMLIEPSHLLLLDEPTNHLDMISRNVLENAMVNYNGSIVCISHDRHFLNQITNIICEVGDGRIKFFEGNYEYYEWKSESNKKVKQKNKKEILSSGKTNYKDRKKSRNRIAWILKRYKAIELEIEINKEIIEDPKNGEHYEKLQSAIEKINILEQEYLTLMEEEEVLQATID
ncbi:MAG: ABC-F family ATP-binding cassette domain-containing protein [Fidelibacterota bacterium]|jgi:ATP-binding cassette subfamily F protein 3|tara:strand:- start:2086 stop:3957 length:1872 start_codon:yes stop_codon:yes gene_type:complete